MIRKSPTQPAVPAQVSTETFAEIRCGIERVSDPIRRAELSDWRMHRVRPMFDRRVLEVSEDVMFKWHLPRALPVREWA